MRDNGFNTMPYSRMAVVHPLGNGMFKNILKEEHIGPFRLRGITKGRWYDNSKSYKTIDKYNKMSYICNSIVQEIGK